MSSPMLTNFLGGSPASVALRLIVVSFVVGMILVTFGFEPADIVESFMRLAHRLVDFGLTDVRQIGRILATGALVVLPVWLVLRLLGVAPRALSVSRSRRPIRARRTPTRSPRPPAPRAATARDSPSRISSISAGPR